MRLPAPWSKPIIAFGRDNAVAGLVIGYVERASDQVDFVAAIVEDRQALVTRRQSGWLPVPVRTSRLNVRGIGSGEEPSEISTT